MIQLSIKFHRIIDVFAVDEHNLATGSGILDFLEEMINITYICFQDAKHLRQHDRNSGEVFDEPGGDCRGENKSTARRTEENRRTAAPDASGVRVLSVAIAFRHFAGILFIR